MNVMYNSENYYVVEFPGRDQTIGRMMRASASMRAVPSLVS